MSIFEHLFIYKGLFDSFIDLHQISPVKHSFFHFSSQNIWCVCFFVIPLHSLSRNAALRFLFSGFVLWKDLHIQRSSTRSVCRIFYVGRWVKETSYHFSWFWCFELDTSDEGSEQRQMECVASLVMVWVFLYLYDECLW